MHFLKKASPIGQAVFERLLKACNEVIWKDDTTSIVVLHQIQVDEPYGPDNCFIIQSSNNSTTTTTTTNNNTDMKYQRHNSSGSSGGGLEDGSLDRVKKIVASAISDA